MADIQSIIRALQTGSSTPPWRMPTDQTDPETGQTLVRTGEPGAGGGVNEQTARIARALGGAALAPVTGPAQELADWWSQQHGPTPPGLGGALAPAAELGMATFIPELRGLRAAGTLGEAAGAAVRGALGNVGRGAETAPAGLAGAARGIREAPGGAVAGSPAGGGAAAESGGSSALRPGGGVGFGSVEEAQRAAAAAMGSRKPLAGLPVKPIQFPDGSYYAPGPIDKLHRAAEDYARNSGIPYNPVRTYVQAEPERAKRIAAAFDAMPHDPEDPRVRASYQALADETLGQYRALKDAGYKFDFIPPGAEDPYAASPRMGGADLAKNNHLWVFPTDTGFGTSTADIAKQHPLLALTNEYVNGKQLRVNDIFRIVHDMFGHYKEGTGFRATGEENAWRSHAGMYSDLARPAMTSETRGQNSWVNFGPHAEANKGASGADTIYAENKAGLLPEWAWENGRLDPVQEAADKIKGGTEPTPKEGFNPAPLMQSQGSRTLSRETGAGGGAPDLEAIRVRGR